MRLITLLIPFSFLSRGVFLPFPDCNFEQVANQITQAALFIVSPLLKFLIYRIG